MNRYLDGYFFRIKDKNGEYINKCFSDLTEEQQDEVMKGKNSKWLKTLCKGMAEALREVGDYFDIVKDYTINNYEKENANEEKE